MLKIKLILMIFVFGLIGPLSEVASGQTLEAKLLAMEKSRFLTCDAFIVNVRAQTIFFDGTYNEPLLMKELRLYKSIKDKRGITEQETSIAGGKLHKELKEKYGSDTFKKLEYLDQKTVECGGEYKLAASKAKLDRPAGPKTVKEYSRIVAQKIGKIQRYPLLAKRRGITGKVVIEFTILKTGQLGKLKIIKSSHDILTKAAIAAIKESVPFPKFPKEINKESLALRMPFNYQM